MSVASAAARALPMLNRYEYTGTSELVCRRNAPPSDRKLPFFQEHFITLTRMASMKLKIRGRGVYISRGIQSKVADVREK